MIGLILMPIKRLFILHGHKVEPKDLLDIKKLMHLFMYSCLQRSDGIANKLL
jgi:hypothetical protein